MYTTYTNFDSLITAELLIKKLLSMLSVNHPDWVVEYRDTQHSIFTANDEMDVTPVTQAIVRDANGKDVFDIMPLLNAHDTDDNGDI